MEEALIKRMIQVGTVSAIQGMTARVIFKESGMTSGWLPVLQHPAAAVTVKEAGDPKHMHEASTTTWMPKINDVVLVGYSAIRNSDGYILGVIP